MVSFTIKGASDVDLRLAALARLCFNDHFAPHLEHPLLGDRDPRLTPVMEIVGGDRCNAIVDLAPRSFSWRRTG